MELDILKHFIKHEVEVLVGGVWVEGTMMPIAKGVVVLLPLEGAKPFYGPTSMKADAIQAIRQIKHLAGGVSFENPPPLDDNVKSSFDGVSPHQRFKNNKAVK